MQITDVKLDIPLILYETFLIAFGFCNLQIKIYPLSAIAPLSNYAGYKRWELNTSFLQRISMKNEIMTKKTY